MNHLHPQHNFDDGDALDLMLRDHVTDELEQYVGTSGKRFEQYIGPGPVTVDAKAQADGVIARDRRRTSGIRLWWTAPLLAAAAAVAMVVIPAVRMMSRDPVASPSPVAVKPHVNPHGPTPQPGLAAPEDSGEVALAAYEPKVSAAVWSEYQDAGRVYLDEQTIARRLVKTDYHRVQWTDPTDNTRVEITVPRQEVVLVSSPKY
jgi:hypothetical protein